MVQLLITAAVLTMAGPKLATKLLFPLLFLVLATPVGESLVPYLMVITADLSAWLLQLSGIPLLREGQYMTLPGGAFVVAEVCSGLRYLLTGAMVALLFGYLTYSSFRKRLILVAVTVVAVIIANGVRAYIVMAVASMTQMRYLGGRDHVYFGWLMFGVVMMSVMWLAARFADEEVDLNAVPENSDANRTPTAVLPLIGGLVLVTLALTANPMQAEFGETGPILAVAAALVALVFLLLRHARKNGDGRTGSAVTSITRLGWRQLLAVVATVVILIAVPRFAKDIESRASSFAYDIDFESIAPCMPVGPWDKQWQPSFEGADVERLATLECSGETVSLYFAAYASALQGSELISSSHEIVPADWDRTSKTSDYALRDRTGVVRSVVEVRINRPGYRALVWYWYEIDGRVASDPLEAKLSQLLALVSGRPAGGSVAVIETSATADIGLSRARLESAARAVIGAGTYVSQRETD
jgi:EpsI family protein